MRFSCESCNAQYMISDEKVGPKGVKVRCKRCGNVVLVTRPPAEAPEVGPSTLTPPPAPERGEGAPETTLDRELGSAFDHVFGREGEAAGSETVAAPRTPAPVPAAFEEPAPPPPPVSATNDWYVAIDDRQVGPLAAAEVKSRWEAGEVGPDTLCWRPGMADWVATSTLPELTEFLSPRPGAGATRPFGMHTVERQVPVAGAPAAAPAPAGTPAAAPAAAPTAPATSPSVNGAQGSVEWKPSAASALAALANEEIAGRAATAKPAAPSETKAGSLVDRLGLPEGGVDPTNVMPLPIKGLETERETPRAAPGRDRAPARRGTPWIPIAAVIVVLCAVAGAAALWLRKGSEPPRVAQAPAAAPAPAPAAPPVAAPEPAPAAAAAPAAPAGQPAAPAAAPAASGEAQAAAPAQPAPAPAEEKPAPAAKEPAAEPPAKEPAKVAAKEPAAKEPAKPPRERKPTKAELAAEARAKRAAQRVASAAPAPAPAAPAPSARKPERDPLLDVGGDDEVDRELSGKGNGKRSVYVPPAIGSDVPDSVSVSQINEAVAGQKASLLRCIDQQKAASPDASGTLRMRWIIQGDGSVRDVRVLSDDLAKQPIAPCISNVVKNTRFPRSRTTGQEVVFPFKF